MSIAGGLPRAVERARAAGCDTLQVFTKSSGQWRARPLPDAEVAAFRQACVELDVQPVMAHASYLINLGSPDDALHTRSRVALGEELDRAEALGLLGVVLHPGSYTTTTEEAGLARIADGIVAVLNERTDQHTRLLLEHTAGQGTNLGHTFQQLGTIIDDVAGAGGGATRINGISFTVEDTAPLMVDLREAVVSSLQTQRKLLTEMNGVARMLSQTEGMRGESRFLGNEPLDGLGADAQELG